MGSGKVKEEDRLLWNGFVWEEPKEGTHDNIYPSYVIDAKQLVDSDNCVISYLISYI